MDHFTTTRHLLIVLDVIWSDQGPQFMSKTFRDFLAEWGFRHVTSTPTYSQSNGKAEATVKSIVRATYGRVHTWMSGNWLVHSYSIASCHHRTMDFHLHRNSMYTPSRIPFRHITMHLLLSGNAVSQRPRTKDALIWNKWSSITIDMLVPFLTSMLALMSQCKTIQLRGGTMVWLWRLGPIADIQFEQTVAEY